MELNALATDIPEGLIAGNWVASSANAQFADLPDNLNNELPKKVLIFIVQDKLSEALPPIVEKMMQACKLSEADYAVFYLAREKVFSWQLLKQRYQPNFAICFGNVAPLLGIQALLMPHKVQQFHGVTWIVTGQLEALTINEDMKKHLWSQMLKPIFLGS